ncbi:MAG: Ig-like domain-containing protein [Clostridia bacterium]|nr:Ig-like domain-containing protein [Clostridia bacterium]
MKNRCMQRILSCLLLISLLIGILPAMADVPALRAYCYAFTPETSQGAVTGFGFKMGAQYGTAPYTLSYTVVKTGGTTLSGSPINAGYVSVPGSFTTGEYTFTASVRDAMGATSTAVMRVNFTATENGVSSVNVSASVAPEAVKAQTITLNSSIRTLRVGATYALSATVLPADTADKTVEYASSNAAVATVSEDGVITAVAPGTCEITCTAKDGGGASSKCNIIVIRSVTAVKLPVTALTVAEGGTYKLQPVIEPADASNKQVTYTSGNKAVVVVANDGTVTGVDKGVATITVASKDDPSKTATVVVTVGTPVASLAVSPTSAGLETGKSLHLQTTITPDTATNKTLEWTSSDPTVATVDNDGCVQAWKAGTAVITAKSMDGSEKTASCTVTVTGETVTPPSDDEITDQPDTRPAGETAYVRTEEGGLNLRKSANQGSTRIRIIPRNAALTVITEGTTWCYVWYDGDFGYVMTKFLSIYEGDSSSSSGSGESAPADGRPAQVDTEKGGLNLRSKPSQSASRKRIIPEDAKFTVVTYGSSWCYAYYKGTYGYVMTKFVKMLDEAQPTPPSSGSGSSSSGDSSGTSSVKATVKTPEGRLNLRKTASINAEIIRRINPGKTVTVLEKGSKWCYVKYSDDTGYVMTKFLDFGGGSGSGSSDSGSQTPPSSDGTKKYAQVTTEEGRLNLRANKSSGSEIIKRIPRNAYVEVLEYGSKWCRVNYNGTKGYVKTEFLTML